MQNKKTIGFRKDLIEEIAQRVCQYLQEQSIISTQQWINEKDAMALIGITSKTSLLKLRNSGQVRFSKVFNKNIMYDRASIIELLNKHAHETF